AFSASPLSARYALRLEELPVDPPRAGARAELLLADPGRVAPVLDSVEGLRWLQSTWAGVNALAASRRRDFTCTRLAGCFGGQMAEYVLGAVFLEDWQRLGAFQAKAEWAPGPFKKRPRLSSLTMGLLGAGDISAVIARRAGAFGMRTVALATSGGPRDGFDEVCTDLPHVLRTSDVVVGVLPSTPQTRRASWTGARWRRAGRQPPIVNVGRGDVVSEASLLDALRPGGPLRRAVLDVFAVEPLPESSALWAHPRVQISPHIPPCVAAVTYPEDTADLFVENLALWLQGAPLKYVVDLDKGY
ncbi:unnamed protein product, partial [Prorocentrum cordatum]